MRNLKALLLSGLLCWLTGNAFGQLIKGEVHDKASHAPVPGASITISSQRKAISTDPSGTFSIQSNGAK
ncbi:MAG TPA: carboxypeptidase-like regulatory domain-containing protein, partial [Puia sp.]|nr:carboxypeptidase-like regulatory domain-containing protein [Puia sp.]